MNVSKYPLDFDSLNKGDVVENGVIENFSGARNGTSKFGIAKMVLAKKIEDHLERRGMIVTVKSIRQGLHILTDIEASEYNADSTKQAIRRMGRCLARISGVDRSEFSIDQNLRHDHRVSTVASAYLAARGAFRNPQLTATERTTPKLME